MKSSVSRYISEINIPDSLSLFSQLGIDPPKHTWQVPTEDCHQVTFNEVFTYLSTR